MRDLDVGFVPIVNKRDAMKLEGVITDRDITVRHVAARSSRVTRDPWGNVSTGRAASRPAIRGRRGDPRSATGTGLDAE
jgi:hypothetical protein